MSNTQRIKPQVVYVPESISMTLQNGSKVGQFRQISLFTFTEDELVDLLGKAWDAAQNRVVHISLVPGKKTFIQSIIK